MQRPANAAGLENLLGSVRLALADYHGALARHRKALELARSIDLRIEIARALDGIGQALRGLGNLAGATRHWQEALDLYDEIGLPEAAATREALASIECDGEETA